MAHRCDLNAVGTGTKREEAFCSGDVGGYLSGELPIHSATAAVINGNCKSEPWRTCALFFELLRLHLLNVLRYIIEGDFKGIWDF